MRRNKDIVLSDFVVPETEEIESLLLCELIYNPNSIMEVRNILTENMFTAKEARELWRIIIEKYDNREQIDITTMFGCGDKGYFTKSILPKMSQCSINVSIEEHALVLKDTFIKRTAYFNAVRTLQMIQDGEVAENIVGQYKAFKDELEKEITDDTTEDMVSIVNKVADNLQKGENKKVTTGIGKLDYYTYGGFGGGQLVILAARPSVGKTTLALQMAMSSAFKERRSVYFSLEMDKMELGQKVLLTSGELQPVQFYTKDIDWSNFERAVTETASEYLMINDDADTLEGISTKISTLVRQGLCDIAYIDYLGLIELPYGNQSVNQQIGYITRKFKRLAKKMKIPIVVLCQLNRESAREDRSPQIYDLRDSGSIEQDADIIMMLEKARGLDIGENDNVIDMWLRKNRGGQKDKLIRLKGDKYYSNFYEYE